MAEKAAVETTTTPEPEDKNKKEVVVEEGNVDYKAEYEKTQAQLKQAEFKLDKLRKDKQSPVKEEELDAMVESKLDEKVNQRLEKIQTELVSDTIESTLESMSDNEDERKLIRFHYDNTLQKTGFTRSAVQNDMRRARLLANESRLAKDMSELKEAAKAKKTVSNSSQGSNQSKAEPEEDPNFTPQDRVLLERRAQKAGLSLTEYTKKIGLTK